MAEGKWIAGLSASCAATDAARRTLRIRLDLVRFHLIHALDPTQKDPEHVHQLRVGIRRAVAALDIFSTLFPVKIHGATRKGLRRLRRSAGQARDWDVLLLALDKQDPAPGLDCLVGYALARRLDAQEVLTSAGRLFAARADEFADELIASLSPADGRPLYDLGRPMLLDLLEQFHLAAGRDLHDHDQLHRTRIVGKRLRYAMEVFADCFPPAFRQELYPRIEEMQGILGQANDSIVAMATLGELRERIRGTTTQWERYRAAFERLIRYHQRRLPAGRRRFLHWWHQWQKARCEKDFQDLLDQPVVDTK